jgi:hypothetical protein
MKARIKKLADSLKRFLKKHWGLWIVLAVALVTSMPLLYDLPLTGHDGAFHMFRYEGILNAWRSGQLVPQLDPAAFGGFGYAQSLFYGPLTGWVVLVLTHLFRGYSFIAVNGMMVLAIFGAAVACYKLVREVTGKTVPAVLASAAYTVAPYHLLDFFIRRADGEFFPFMFAPMVFLGLWRLMQNDTKKNAILPLVIGGAGMVLSHNLSALIWAVTALVFLLLNWRAIFGQKKWKVNLPKLIYSGVLMLLISAIFILPMLEARDAALYNIFNPIFAETNMGQTAEAVWHRGLIMGELFFRTHEAHAMFFLLGIVFCLGILSFAVARKKMPPEVRKFTRQMMIIGLVTAFMATTWFFPWQWAPSIFTTIQFPWRLLTITSLGLAVTAGISIYYLVQDWADKNEKTIPKWSIATAGAVLIVAAAAPLVSMGLYHDRWDHWFDYRLTTLVNHPSRGWWYATEYEYLPSRVMDCTYQPQCQLKEEMPEWLLARKAEGIIRVCDADSNLLSPSEQTTCSGYLEYPMFFYPAYEAQTLGADARTLEVFESPNGLVAVRVGENVGVGTSQRELPFAYGVIIDEANGIKVTYGTSRATAIGFVLSAFGLASLVTYSIMHRRRNRKQKP